ncbi:GNAT family N-acetyltransferase [Rhizohabitans arisaemae]|uniref:GNAT family N-acetyltransferase n=1 Tax=Rhizohabitans arisaemae TaxID=2720610 RepID=UPI0024B1CA9A|nr:GNAT family N-acetyltransferase [Rhizohabitans arisaemae]
MSVDLWTPGTTVSTGRLLLRPWEEGDVEDCWAAVHGDPEIGRWMPWAEDYTVETARDWCTVHAHANPRTSLNFAIVPQDRSGSAPVGGPAVGSIGLTRFAAMARVPTVEIGYWLAAPARGRGYMYEAVGALSVYAFETGAERVEILAASGNEASQRVALKCGFTREGTLRGAGRVTGGVVDLVVFGLLPGETP